MSTRSNIALKLENGQYMQAYCHYDGYPEHMGPALKHFTSYDDVAQLVSEEIRCIDEETGVFERFNDGEKSDIQEKPTFDNEYLYVWEDGRWWILNEALERKPLHQDPDLSVIERVMINGVKAATQDG